MIFSSWKKKKVSSEIAKSSSEEVSKRENETSSNREILDENNTPSLLGKEIKIIGKIFSKGAIQLDGILEGEITASKLVIEKSAKVVGSVTSEDLVIKGRIIGPVFGKKVRFGSSARVEGDTFHETIAIEDGAYYEGSIKRHTTETAIPTKIFNSSLAKRN